MEHTGLEGFQNLFVGQLFAVQILHHQFFVSAGSGFGERFQSGGDIIGHIGGNRHFLGLALVHTLVSLVFQNVYDALVVCAGADRQNNGANAGAELFAQSGGNLHKVGMVAVHLVDDEHLAYVVLGGQRPGLFSADGDAVHSAYKDGSGLNNAQGTHGLADKIEVAGNIDHVEHLLVPVNGGNSRADGDLSLDFFRFKVGHGVAVFRAALTVDCAGSEQQCLHQRRFAFAAMPHEGDVTDVFGFIACHYRVLLGYIFCTRRIPRGKAVCEGNNEVAETARAHAYRTIMRRVLL